MKRIAAVLACLALVAPALATAEDAAALYAQKCAACHGKDGKGTPAGKKLGAKDLTKIEETEAQVASVIENGKGKMTPIKGKLTPAEIASLAKYVKAGLKE